MIDPSDYCPGCNRLRCACPDDAPEDEPEPSGPPASLPALTDDLPW